MTENETKNTRGISRRTVARTAAWSVPAVAVVAAAPAYAAASSVWDAQVTGLCDGKSSDSVLLSGLKLAFQIKNVGTAPIPAATTFQVTIPSGIALNVLTGANLVGLQLLGILDTGTTAQYQTTAPLANGQTATFTLPDSLVSAMVGAAVTMQLTSSEPSGALSSNNKATLTVTQVGVGGLDVLALCQAS